MRRSEIRDYEALEDMVNWCSKELIERLSVYYPDISERLIDLYIEEVREAEKEDSIIIGW